MTPSAVFDSWRSVTYIVLLAGSLLGASGCVAENQESLGSSGSDLSSCASGTTLRGVDVSSYQGSIDWSSAKSSGIAFGFAKATEGDTLEDSTFAANWAGMKSAGVVRGAYHFFHPSESATAQASFVLSKVGTLEAGDLPIVLDFEVLDGVSEASAVADAVTFLQTVTQATGKTAILYMSADFLGSSYPALSPYTLWVANYGVSCPGLPSEWPAWSFWQNSDSGNVSGISGGTDTDVFNGSLSALAALAGGSGGGSSGGGGSSSGGSSSGGGSGSGSGGGSGSGSGGSSQACSLGGHTYAQGTCTETLQCDSGSWVARSSDPSGCVGGVEPNGACLTDNGTVAPENTCTSTLQCDSGVWVERVSDPAMCLGSTSTSCSLAGTTYAQNTCTQTLQCDSGEWVTRSSDPSSCSTGVEPSGGCVTDSGSVVPQNTCTTTLQCDDGVWMARSSDPTACL
jgi:lysozyme